MKTTLYTSPLWSIVLTVLGSYLPSLGKKYKIDVNKNLKW
jgi:hypothetical protein